MSEQYLTLRKAANLLHISPTSLSQSMNFLIDFPAAEWQGGYKRYSKTQIESWAMDKDVKALIRAALTKVRSGCVGPDAEKSMQLHRRLTAGEFATAEQKQQFAMKRLVARTLKPKTHRITIIPDWMREDDYQPNRANKRKAHG